MRIEIGQVWRFRETGTRVEVTSATDRTIGWVSLSPAPSPSYRVTGGGPREHFLAIFEPEALQLEVDAPPAETNP